jgi:hypothetical protein
MSHVVARLEAFAGMSRMKRLALVVLCHTVTSTHLMSLKVGACVVFAACCCVLLGGEAAFCVLVGRRLLVSAERKASCRTRLSERCRAHSCITSPPPLTLNSQQAFAELDKDGDGHLTPKVSE